MTAHAGMVDMAFAVTGGRLPAEHRQALADAIDAALPWLAVMSGVGMHPLKLARGGPEPLLSARTRLTLRLPRDRAAEAAALAGRELTVGAGNLRLGDAHWRELLPWGTLYAHCVMAAEGDDELAFQRAVQMELDALGVAGRVICGLARRGADGAIQGYGVMVDGLSADDSLTLQQQGMGAGRRFGYGLFVPHKSAAAVGAPDCSPRMEEEATMSYIVNGETLETDDQGYLLEPDYRDEVVEAIAQAEGLALTDDHWKVVHFLRDEYRENGHTPNFRNMLKGLADILPGCDSKALYDLFPVGPAKQGAKVAGLPQPLGKGGY